MIETADVAMTIVGSAVKPREARNSASRVALPPTNCAVTAPAPSMAVTIELGWERGSGILSLRSNLYLVAPLCCAWPGVSAPGEPIQPSIAHDRVMALYID